AAVRVIQGVVMRLLATLPPGKVRLTVIDPVGLGSDFGAFLHLADHEELVEPILTEPHDIERSLGDLCGHVEKIIQSYLRAEHGTIGAFNARAGGMAEPFRVLVVCDFPTGFEGASASRFSRVIAHGARCGVLTLVVTDPAHEVPPDVPLHDLAAR